MELQLKASPKLKVVYEEKEYFLGIPNMGQRIELEKKLKEVSTSGASANEVLIDFISGCGIPKDVLMGMEEELIDQLVQALAPKKKG